MSNNHAFGGVTTSTDIIRFRAQVKGSFQSALREKYLSDFKFLMMGGSAHMQSVLTTYEHVIEELRDLQEEKHLAWRAQQEREILEMRRRLELAGSLVEMAVRTSFPGPPTSATAQYSSILHVYSSPQFERESPLGEEGDALQPVGVTAAAGAPAGRTRDCSGQEATPTW